MANKKKFSWKVFISISLFFTFFIIFITGILLYISPPGRVAHWVNWKILGLGKEQWQSVHTNFSYLFAILSIFHLFTINWRAFWTYIKRKATKGINKKREFYISSVLTVLIFAAVLYEIPPFSSVMTFGEYLSESWEKKDEQPPVPHTEKMTIPQLAEQLEGFTSEQIINRLKNNKITVDTISLTLQEIGEKNNMSPQKIYELITKKPENSMSGRGIGKRSLKDIAEMNNATVGDYIKILKENNISAKETMTLKDIAEEYDMAARDIYELLTNKNVK